MPHAPARTLATLTAALGTLTAFAVAAVGPAAAATLTESRPAPSVAGASGATERLLADLRTSAGLTEAALPRATEEEILELIKSESETLYNKLVELRNLLKGKLDALTPDAKAFVNGTIEAVKALKPKGDEKPDLEEVRKVAKNVIEQYKALSDEAKESLKAQFPKLAALIEELRTTSSVITQLENILKITQILQPSTPPTP